MKFISNTIKLLIIAAIGLFSYFNREGIDVVVFPDKIIYSTYLFVPILGALVIGFIVAAIFFMADLMRLNKELKVAKKKMTEMETDLNRLKGAPLAKDDLINPELND